MALYRRLKNMQARAEQKFMYDFLPLILCCYLYSITGLVINLYEHLFAWLEVSQLCH